MLGRALVILAVLLGSVKGLAAAIQIVVSGQRLTRPILTTPAESLMHFRHPSGTPDKVSETSGLGCGAERGAGHGPGLREALGYRW